MLQALFHFTGVKRETLRAKGTSGGGGQDRRHVCVNFKSTLFLAVAVTREWDLLGVLTSFLVPQTKN